MRRRWQLPGVLSVLLALVIALNCDRGPTDPVAPQTPSADLVGGLLRGRPAPAPAGIKLIVEDGPHQQGLVTGLFGVLGGVLQLDGHTLIVPRGAVLQPTLFTMATPSSEVIDVELNVLGGDLLRGTLSRLLRFETAVTVELSYARASNVTNPDKLMIVRLLENGRYEVVPSQIDKTRKVVTARLDHFSKYAMASN
jgi:hypothetical protein